MKIWDYSVHINQNCRRNLYVKTKSLLNPVYHVQHMKRVLLLLSLGLLITPVMAADDLVLSVKTDQKTYEANERGVMTLTFSNDSQYKFEDIRVRIKSNNILFFIKEDTIEELTYGSTALEFKFQCRNLKEGTYSITIFYDYTSTSKQCQGGVCQKLSGTRQHEITIQNGEPHISLESNRLEVVNNKTTLTFKNTDEVALDFKFEIISSIIIQYESYMGSLLTRVSEEIVVYGDPGEYQGNVRVTYRDRFGRNYTREFPVRIVIKEGISQDTVLVQPIDLSSNSVEQGDNPKHVDNIPKIQVKTASTQGVPISQYYVYFMVFSCLFLIVTALFVKVRNMRTY